MFVTGTYFNLYNVCKRELWLHANNIRFEQTSELVYDGKLIHEETYPQRPERYEELEVDGIKIDFYDAKNKIVHEIKRSDKVEDAHEWQVKYYIYVLEQNGIDGVKGVLEYPTLRKTTPIVLTDEDRREIEKIKDDIETIILSDKCPEKVNMKICKSCSYYDFCNVSEMEEI